MIQKGLVEDWKYIITQCMESIQDIMRSYPCSIPVDDFEHLGQFVKTRFFFEEVIFSLIVLYIEKKDEYVLLVQGEHVDKENVSDRSSFRMMKKHLLKFLQYFLGECFDSYGCGCMFQDTFAQEMSYNIKTRSTVIRKLKKRCNFLIPDFPVCA